MRCQYWRERIEEQAGGSLCDDVTAHIGDCADCRQYHIELQRSVNSLFAGEFSVSESEQVRMSELETTKILREVERTIDLADKRKNIARTRMKIVAAAAAILVVSGSLITLNIGDVETHNPVFIGIENVDLTEGLDDEGFDFLLTEFEPGGRFDIEEAIVEGLSDEDMEFLEQSFRIGDLL